MFVCSLDVCKDLSKLNDCLPLIHNLNTKLNPLLSMSPSLFNVALHVRISLSSLFSTLSFWSLRLHLHSLPLNPLSLNLWICFLSLSLLCNAQSITMSLSFAPNISHISLHPCPTHLSSPFLPPSISVSLLGKEIVSLIKGTVLITILLNACWNYPAGWCWRTVAAGMHKETFGPCTSSLYPSFPFISCFSLS